MSKYDPSSMKISTGCAHAFTVDKVEEEDIFQYSLCINTWCYVVQDLAGLRSAEELRLVIDAAGLYKTIESADAAAGRILNGETTIPYFKDDLFGLWLQICESAAALNGQYSEEWMAIATGLALRFPKRFTIAGTTKDNLKDFLECQSNCHLMNAVWSARPGETLMRHVARNMARILRLPFSEEDKDPDGSNAWSKGEVRRLNDAFIRRETYLGAPFSSGACFYPNGYSGNPKACDTTSRVTALKYAYVCSCGRPDLVFRPHLDDDWLDILPFVGATYPSKINIAGRGLMGSPSMEHVYSAALASVPKNYAERRMIAPETPYLNAIARQTRSMLLALVTVNGFLPFMNPNDQSVNRELARLGSLHSSKRDPRWNYCTIDARHASDSIPRQLFFELLYLCDPRLRFKIRASLADQLFYNNVYHYSPQILATSGSPLTPILQSIYYTAIVMTAYDYCGLSYEGDYPTDLSGSDMWDVNLPFAIYNDDIIVKEEAFQTVVDMLQIFNITVNTSKTFHGDNPYRESCGGEFAHGVDITGCYWPRKPISCDKGKLSTEAVSAIVSLQHRLHARGLSSADMYLSRVLLGAVPTMTASRPFTESDDVWVKWRSEFDDATQAHYKATVTYSKPLRCSAAKFGKGALEAISYLSFLRNGPSYATALDELLGISSPRDAYLHCDETPSESSKLQRPSVKVK